MERITSRNNPLIKDTKKLMTSSKERRTAGRFVLEGARLSFDVLHSVYGVKTLLLTETAREKYQSSLEALINVAQEVYLISDEVAQKLGDTKSPQGIFTVCTMQTQPAAIGKKVIALDRVQDPANIGAIFRTAEALGVDTILTGGSCDVYHPKVLRASMGGVLRMQPVETDDLTASLAALKKTHAVYATVPDSKATPIQSIDFSVPTVCVIGNEANGVSEEIKAMANALITIPMQGRAESLNAGAAAAITMWEMLR